MLALLILLAPFAAIFAYIQQPKFGKKPAGERLERIKKSPHFRQGAFQNLSPTPSLTEGSGYISVFRQFFFGDRTRVKPDRALPALKTDLFSLPPDEHVLVWFGHSSYFIQIDGKKILVDPVLSGAASPIRSTTLSFTGTDVYTAADIPDIDYLFISHDHWDHLDHQTMLRLQPKIGMVICSLGTGAHLERWGFEPEKIRENDWHDSIRLHDGFAAHAVPARHFSGRGIVRNQALWTAFVLQTPTMRLFLGGDSGYDTHFAEIGAQYGPFDLAILECGQYDKHWKYIHMLPEEVPQATRDLRAKRLLPVHWGKFGLANHDWDDPIVRVLQASINQQVPMAHPMIGEKVRLNDADQVFSTWWEAN